MKRITQKLFDSRLRANLITSRTDIDFRIYLNRTYFTDLDKSKAGHLKKIYLIMQ